jgi:F-type H+-transporting ATPase subunit gamma
MPNLQEIKDHINNINTTKQMTRAMYLISVSKSQKARGQLENADPYFQQITATMCEILASTEELSKGTETPYILTQDEIEGPAPPRDLYLIIAADKGLAGGYSRVLTDFLAGTVRKDRDRLIVAGMMGRQLLRGQGYRIDERFGSPVMNPNVYRAREVAEVIIKKYLSHHYRDIYIVFTRMISAMKQEPVMLKLLPLDVEALKEYAPPPEHRDEVEYVPSPPKVFEKLVPYYLKGIIYSAFVEAFASEQQSRLMAMDGATKSANDTIERLTVQHNRARQAKITQELNEIISGIPHG